MQSYRTNAKLALFTCKLGVAILIAAVIRVHDGWHAIYAGFPNNTVTHSLRIAWNGLSFYLAPMLFLAAGTGHHLQDRERIVMTAWMGVAIPLGERS